MTALHPEIGPDEAALRRDDFRIIDVREASEFEGPLGHIAGAELVPASDLRARSEDLAGGAPLLVVCRSGRRSAHACDALAEAGAPGATNLVGGMIAWHRAGLPVERRPLKDAESIFDALTTWVSQVRGLERSEAEIVTRGCVAHDPSWKGELTGAVLLHAISQLVVELREGGSPPPDVDLACGALHADAAALADRERNG